MQYTTLGKTDLSVSRLCLGCMTFGEPDRGNHAWTLPEESSRPIIKRAIDGGINFFDTANSYSDGSSEEIVGRALRDFARRDEIVVATKVYYPSGDLAEGLSRAQILRSIDDSLRRLNMDYVDLLQIHRWDYNTPIEETLEALNDVVKAGKARYIGATRAQVALAWLLGKRGVAAPIIGTSREEQLDELLSAVDLSLTPEQVAELETPYQQHPVVGFK
ncbi:aldo/keto reductase [Enterobacter bugandensis]|uniref:aldo/keto reductase n=1 Tax=Enterobacter bugandensis TaxID=881260 RepID=UPI002075CC4A|nr:aldo/keto reductase [Enterobacter bugandensis]MCM7471333.1 aldo/keto reductase [Enterobacter bugandensis]